MADEIRKQEVPVAKVVFDAHTAALAKGEAANRAVYDAMVAMVEWSDPMAKTVFNATPDQLKAIVSGPKEKLNSIFKTGFPIFSLAMASDKFAAVLRNSEDVNVWLRTLRDSFSQPLPITSLSGNSADNVHDVQAKEAVFDTQQAVRVKIEAASRAVQDFVVTLVHNRDPLAPVFLNATWEQLDAIANASKSRLNTIFMTGCPIFSLSQITDRFATILTGADDYDGILRVTLESFAPIMAAMLR